MGFERMTPVQAATIPMFSANKDVVVDSVTGSGKTLAFVIPIIEKLLSERRSSGSPQGKNAHFFALVLAPTRELSNQIYSVIESFLEHYPDTQSNNTIRAQLLIGNSKQSIRDDMDQYLETKPQILVGTPGRVLDFVQNQRVRTQDCGMVVLDEADRLLDISFIEDVEKILRLLPKQRRTGLFSATIASSGNNVFRTGLRNPVNIKVKTKERATTAISTNFTTAPSSLSFDYVVMKPEYKLLQLLHILGSYRFAKSIVYFATCTSVTYFYSLINYLRTNPETKHLFNEDTSFFSLHGKLETTSRLKTLQRFTDNLGSSVLLTTDVAARGIDIAGVDLVIQIDPPTDVDMFLHRCGRTGRLNRVGKAVTFLNSGREEDFVGFMEVKNLYMNRADDQLLASDETLGLDSTQFYNVVKTWLLQDRARFEHAVKSYVGFIRYYSKHSAKSIFRLASLDYVSLCKMYGLFRLPRMPEINRAFSDGPPRDDVFPEGWLVDPPIDMDKFAYQDPKREKHRLAELAKAKDAMRDEKHGQSNGKRKDDKFNQGKSTNIKKNDAWSNKLLLKEQKLNRREKMRLKRKAIEEELARHSRNNGSDTDDEDELTVMKDWKDEVLSANKKRKQQRSVMQGSFDDL